MHSVAIHRLERLPFPRFSRLRLHKNPKAMQHRLCIEVTFSYWHRDFQLVVMDQDHLQRHHSSRANEHRRLIHWNLVIL
jgi:hypothetical protein